MTKRTNNDLQIITQITTDRALRITLNCISILTSMVNFLPDHTMIVIYQSFRCMQFIFHNSYSYSYISTKLFSQGYLKIACSDPTKILLRRYQHLFEKYHMTCLHLTRGGIGN
jgi:hypothetical protein